MAKNILICDDAAFMRMMIKDILTKNGYNVVGEAENGLKAVEKYSETKPDLVLMDITMPEMDGIQALKKIKEQHHRFLAGVEAQPWPGACQRRIQRFADDAHEPADAGL